MPTVELSRPETIWPWINSDQDTMIEEMKKELEKNGGRKITIDQYELSSTETKSLDPKTLEWRTINSSSSPELYKQLALQSSADGTIPILKQNHFKMSNGDIKLESDSMNSSPSPLPVSPTNEIKYNRPESSLSQAISIDMASRSSSSARDRSVSPSRRSRSEKNVSIGKIIEESESEVTVQPEKTNFVHTSWPHGIDINNRSQSRSSRTVSPVRSSSRGISPVRSSSRSDSPGQWAIVERSQTHEIKRSPTPFAQMGRPASVPPFDAELITLPRYKKKVISQPSSPLPDYLTKLRHIKVATVPVPVPPKFGTLTQGGRWPNEAAGPVDIGPPCELCKKPITDTRFIHHQGFLYHVDHFTCSYCFKSLRPYDFQMSSDDKPYCINCYRREFH